MKKLLLVFSLSLITGAALLAGCAGSTTVTPGQETPARIIEDVTPQEAFNLIQENQNDPDFVILDVRTTEEFSDGYIENAVNIDFYTDTFRDDLDNLDKNKTYLIYCRSGGRSGKTLDIMEELEFREVHNVSGGIIAWNEEELPTIK